MISQEANPRRKYLGSFRIHLAPDASTELVPTSSLINLVNIEEHSAKGRKECHGDVVLHILEGVGKRLTRGWKFSVKGEAFGWNDSQIRSILCNNREIFSENGAKG